jgi:hypothetical protein
VSKALIDFLSLCLRHGAARLVGDLLTVQMCQDFSASLFQKRDLLCVAHRLIPDGGGVSGPDVADAFQLLDRVDPDSHLEDQPEEAIHLRQNLLDCHEDLW